jgi:hypothetical protein
LAGWLTDWLAGWLAGWLPGCWLVGWLLAGCGCWLAPKCIRFDGVRAHGAKRVRFNNFLLIPGVTLFDSRCSNLYLSSQHVWNSSSLPFWRILEISVHFLEETRKPGKLPKSPFALSTRKFPESPPQSTPKLTENPPT